MRRLPLLAILSALFLLPATASAATIGGSHLDDDTWVCDTGESCVLVQDKIAGNTGVGAAPSAGKITGFTVGSQSGPFRFLVLRGSGSNRDVVTQSDEIDETGSPRTYTFNTPVQVQAGDRIGVLLGASSAIGVRDYSGGPSLNNLLQYSADDLWTLQDQGPYEISVSAIFVPTPTSNGGGGTPAKPPVKVNTPVKTVQVKPDPLAALKAGKKPKARIGGGVVTASAKRVAPITVSNPNGYALRGSLSVVAGKVKLGAAKVNLPAGAAKAFKLKLSRKGMKKLRKKRQLRATAVTKLKGPVGKAGVTRKSLTLKAPAKPKPRKKAKKKGGSGGGGGGTGGGGSTPQSNEWVARLGDSGAYDDFGFTLDGNKITVTKPALILVTCARTGAMSGISGSSEIFNHEGPWTLGQSVPQTKTGVAVNQYVGRGARGITYKLASQRSGNKITGSLTMTFSDSQLVPWFDPISGTTQYKMAFINCAGTRNFEAVAG